MISKLIRAAAVVAVAALVSAAAPVQAHSVARPQGGAYYLEVAFDDGPRYDAVLTCPDGRTHPRGPRACDQLAAVDGDIGSIRWAGTVCTTEHRPVTVRAHGVWEGRYRHYRGRFGNLCTAVSYTGGHVFAIAER
ncbi:SSI family serine proteinase inhibitor [Glycomyces xiaoerkulensis]|uniref:SSI family serine proteinase inhibitor n=1 Tax=Glycomyces xiaoerkulensis TaxID=2038139 RepID=UPI000C26AE97|nr:SSI family serine proteinase inhibitor [Glycomyces xiaoerkulensis]